MNSDEIAPEPQHSVSWFQLAASGAHVDPTATSAPLRASAPALAPSAHAPTIKAANAASESLKIVICAPGESANQMLCIADPIGELVNNS
jgi:hypothetical protein